MCEQIHIIKKTFTLDQKLLFKRAKNRKKYNDTIKELFYNHLKQSIIGSMSKKYNSFDKLYSLFDIYTTRYNSDTYLQNQRYKENMGFCGSLYSTTLELPKNTSLYKYLFVLDMNNTTNKIMGIGLIKNKLALDQSIKIYDNPLFNNYIYKSKYYVSLQDVEDQKIDIDEKWLTFIEEEFEYNLFYGKSNLKRGGSYTRFPFKKLKYKHLHFLFILFMIVNPNHFNENIVLKHL